MKNKINYQLHQHYKTAYNSVIFNCNHDSGATISRLIEIKYRDKVQNLIINHLKPMLNILYDLIKFYFFIELNLALDSGKDFQFHEISELKEFIDACK